MKFGHQLPYAVADELVRRGYLTDVIAIDSDEARRERIDLRVRPRDPLAKPFEFQLTLRHFVKGKMAHFMHAAMTGRRVGPRVYLEIFSPYCKTLMTIARRVANAIIEIVAHMRHNFEKHKLAGFRLRIGKTKFPKIERFSLFQMAGNLLKDIIAEAREKRLALERVKAEARRKLREMQESLIERMKNRPVLWPQPSPKRLSRANPRHFFPRECKRPPHYPIRQPRRYAA